MKVITTPERNQDLADIHKMARDLGMSEFARRALQFEVTGKESCLLMTEDERRAVITALEEETAKRRPATEIDDSDEFLTAMLEGFQLSKGLE